MRKSGAAALSLVLSLGLAACGPAAIPSGVSDPYEAQNRAMFEENLALDRALFGGSGRKAGTGGGGLARRVSAFAANLRLPSVVVNDLAQGRIEDAVHNTARFAFNTTLGVAGLFDVATDIGLEERDTDFGETLHVWGVPEGNFVMLPLLGPSTERDALGMVVDLFTNPLTYALHGRARYLPPAANIAGRFADRVIYGDALDELIYSAEDPYATARLYYLDNRRHKLARGTGLGQDLYSIYGEAYD